MSCVLIRRDETRVGCDVGRGEEHLLKGASHRVADCVALTLGAFEIEIG
jgi:hypothetical protein